MYLGQVFPGRDVDVNYNRHGRDPKQIGIPEECGRGGGRGRVTPDVIVHQRGNDDHNLLVIEIKKSTNNQPRECDLAKVQSYRRELGYLWGAFVELEAGVENPSVVSQRWFGI